MSIHRAVAVLAAGSVLWMVVHASWGQDTASQASAGPAVTVRLVSPAGAQFGVASKAMLGSLSDVVFAPAEVTPAPAPARDARQTTLTADVPGEGTRRLTLTADDMLPQVSVSLSAPKGASGVLVLRLGGADRLIVVGKDGYAVSSPSQPVELAARQFACQARRDQSGLAVSIAGGEENSPVTVASTPQGLEVRIPWQSQDADRPATAVLVRGFLGDAAIAMEDLPKAGDVGGPSMSRLPQAEPRQPTPVEGSKPLEWIPGTRRAFEPLLADPTEATTRIGYMYDGQSSKNLMDFKIGGDIVMAQKVFAKDERLTGSVRGLITGRLDLDTDSRPLQNSDYYGGFAAGYRKGPHELEAYLFHESSHLGDELIDSGDKKRIDFSHEAIRLLYARHLGPFRLYAGPTFSTDADPEPYQNAFVLQAGAEVRYRIFNVPSYLAFDVQSRQPNDWHMNYTVQTGMELGDPLKVENRPRVFLEFMDGHSNMGQFWDIRETYVMMGLAYDF